MTNGSGNPQESNIVQTDPRCRPLARMRQLALEIASAVERNDQYIVKRASALLPSALEQCNRIDPDFMRDTPEARRFVAETRRILDESERALLKAQERVASELRRVRATRKNRSWILQQEYAVVGKRLDMSK